VCLLAEFHQRKTGIEVKRQRVCADLIEGSATIVRVRHFHEPANQFRPFATRTYGIVKRRPRTTVLGVHQERLARGREQETFVAHHREARVAALLRAENARGVQQILGRVLDVQLDIEVIR